jgi:branched-chain amino acid aminotransferase
MNNHNTTTYLWLDGKSLAKDETSISPLTHGLHYGTGAFEGIRVYHGKIFKLTEHIERFINSAKILMIDIAFSAAELMQACEEIIKLNQITDGYIRPLVFLGDQRIEIGEDNNVHVMIACWKRPSPYFTTLIEKKPLRLNISSIIKPAPESFTYGAKASGLYILNHLAKKRAIAEGYDDSLMIDYRSFISEATTANFFMVKDGTLYTPTTECCLNGITRQVVIKISQENNIKVIEKHLSLADLKEADEAFLTGTAAEINAIFSIADYQFAANPISQFIYSKFYQLTQSL